MNNKGKHARVRAQRVYAEMVRACCVCVGRLSLHCTVCGNFMDIEDPLLKEENNYCVASQKTSAIFNKKRKMEMDLWLKRFCISVIFATFI